MRKVIYAINVSVDGYIEAANGDISWTDPDDEVQNYWLEQDRSRDTFLYGRRLYENMAAFWPTADENPAATEFERAYAKSWREKKKIVFSRGKIEVGWNAKLFKGELKEEINKLKAQPGGDLSVAGAGLAASFMELGLIDEYQLVVHPVILGGGKAMFPALREKIGLRLVEMRRIGAGVVMIRMASEIG